MGPFVHFVYDDWFTRRKSEMPQNCPDKATIEAFLLGRLDDAESHELSDHLNQCSECEQTIEGLESETNEVLTRLRRPAPVDEYANESECRIALDRIVQLAQVSHGDATLTESAFEIDSVRRIRDYELLEKLGQGGMGAVYKALHTKLKRVVALKVLTSRRMEEPEAVARFEREMEAVGALDHPNIVRASDAGEVDGTHYLVMEYVEGIDLSKLVRQTGPLATSDACVLIRQAAVGLHHAYEAGLVHRDIKPSNLMLTRHGGVKILDMGLALLQQTQGEELTSTGQLMGTVDYMAPEQGGNSHTVDIRADVYSLGATLYKLLSGIAPFGGDKYDTVMKKLRALGIDDPPSLSESCPQLPPELVTVVNRMLGKTPDDRYSTPAAVADALGPFCAGHDLVALVQLALGPDASESKTADGGSTNRVRSQFSGTQPDHIHESSRPGDQVTQLATTDEYPQAQSSGQSSSKPAADGKLAILKPDSATPRKLRLVIACLVSVTLVIAVSLGLFNGSDNEDEEGANQLSAIQAQKQKDDTKPLQEPPTNFALQFDGSTSRVDLPIAFDHKGPLTVEAWVLPAELPPGEVVIVRTAMGDAKATAFGLAIHDGRPVFGVGAVGWKLAHSDIPLKIGQLVHLAGVYDETGARIYVDGKLHRHAQFQHPRGGSEPRTIQIGANSETQNVFNGIIDEVRISTAAVYQSEFEPQQKLTSGDNTLALYHFDAVDADETEDSSGNNYTGKVIDAKSVASPIGSSSEESTQPVRKLELFTFSDEFNDAATLKNWSVFRTVPTGMHREGTSVIESLDINVSRPGHLTVFPASDNGWFQDGHGGMVSKDITGDFVVSTRVRVVSRSDPEQPPQPNFNQAGLMARVPNSERGGEQWLLLAIGQQREQPGIRTESAFESRSFEVTRHQDVNETDLRLARIGDTFFAFCKPRGEQEWQQLTWKWRGHTEVERLQISRQDEVFPQMLQVGVVTNGWAAADMIAEFDWVRFDVPSAFADLTKPLPLNRQ